MRLHFRSDDHTNLIEMLRRGEADFAVVSPSQVPNEMSSKVLKADRYLLVGSPSWTNRKLDTILRDERIIDFYESDNTTARYLQAFGLDKLPRRGRLFINDNETLVRYFGLGIGFGTLTESVARPFLENGQLIKLNGGKPFEDPLALTWLPRSKPAVFIENIIRSIR